MNTNDKDDVTTLKNFVNDECWGNRYNYKPLSNKEITELYTELKEHKKLNLHRKDMAEYVLKKFPHRMGTAKSMPLKPVYILLGLGGITLLGALGAIGIVIGLNISL